MGSDALQGAGLVPAHKRCSTDKKFPNGLIHHRLCHFFSWAGSDAAQQLMPLPNYLRQVEAMRQLLGVLPHASTSILIRHQLYRMFNTLLNIVVFQERHLPLKGKRFSLEASCLSCHLSSFDKSSRNSKRRKRLTKIELLRFL